MKIHSKNNKVQNTKLIVPIDGLVTIDGEGIADVSPKCAVLLVSNTNDWEYVKNAKSQKDTEETLNDPDEGTNDDGDGNVPTEDERALLEEKLNSSTVKELQAMCQEANLPEEEWNKLTKKLLVKYLMDKYDNTEEK